MSSSGRVRLSGALGALLVAVLVAAGLGSPAEAATAKPSGLGASNVATGPVLKWRPVKRATSYRVEISATRSYDSAIFAASTTNIRLVPTTVLPLGKIFWRVQAVSPAGVSKWATDSFTRNKRGGPQLIGPADGAQLEQPESPPVLKWKAVPGARSYEVEIDGDERDWVDTEQYTTKTTALVVDEPQPNGSYWWRVSAVMGNGVNTQDSAERSYRIGPLRTVRLNDTAATMQEVVLEWDPVPGAVAYEIRVSTDNGFNTITDQRIVSGTRYSPNTTYNNASYWWQVRAKNALGQAEEWPTYPDRTGEFRRYWPEKPTLLHPGANPTGDLWFQWSPVHLATHYSLDVGTDPGFSSSQYFRTCVTTQTTYTPGWGTRLGGTDGCMPKVAGTYYWRVQAVDGPKNVNGIFSEVGSFTFTPPTASTGSLGEVTGEQLMLDGDGSSPCAVALDQVCDPVTATPMFNWDPVPGAAYYRIYLAHDREFTNMVSGYGDSGSPNTLPATVNTRWMPTRALPDTQAGEAYYWYIRACDATDRCGLTPSGATHAFRKKSAPVGLLQPTSGATLGDQVVFDWTDYLDTNQSTTDPATHENPTQAAKQYRIQVSDTQSFAKLVDDQTVDQTTYTAFDRAYPEGSLWWRVQAIDGSGNGLTWSEPRQFTKASPTPKVIGPTSGEVIGGVQPFRWEPLAYAKYYDLEVYRNNDRTASSVNRALTAANIRHTAFASKEPLEALGSDFVWRVRRTDYSGNKSDWGPWHAFRVGAAAPKLKAPKAGVRISGKTAFLEWRPTAQAASYVVELRHAGGAVYRVGTASTSYAPTWILVKGKWKWRVTGLDTNGRVLRVSGWRSFKAK